MQADLIQKRIDRWDILSFIYSGGAIGVGQRSIALFLLARNQREYGVMYLQDLLTDLRDRGYVSIEEHDNMYHCKIKPLGRDLVDYNVTCPDAIARPPQPTTPNA